MPLPSPLLEVVDPLAHLIVRTVCGALVVLFVLVIVVVAVAAAVVVVMLVFHVVCSILIRWRLQVNASLRLESPVSMMALGRQRALQTGAG